MQTQTQDTPHSFANTKHTVRQILVNFIDHNYSFIGALKDILVTILRDLQITIITTLIYTAQSPTLTHHHETITLLLLGDCRPPDLYDNDNAATATNYTPKPIHRLLYDPSQPQKNAADAGTEGIGLNISQLQSACPWGNGTCNCEVSVDSIVNMDESPRKTDHVS